MTIAVRIAGADTDAVRTDAEGYAFSICRSRKSDTGCGE
jgi:hypothetical protein